MSEIPPNGRYQKVAALFSGITLAAMLTMGVYVFTSGVSIGATQTDVNRAKQDITVLAELVRDLLTVTTRHGVTSSEHERRLNDIERRLEASWGVPSRDSGAME